MCLLTSFLLMLSVGTARPVGMKTADQYRGNCRRFRGTAGGREYAILASDYGGQSY
jgi:hypothetical protein